MLIIRTGKKIIISMVIQLLDVVVVRLTEATMELLPRDGTRTMG